MTNINLKILLWLLPWTSKNNKTELQITKTCLFIFMRETRALFGFDKGFCGGLNLGKMRAHANKSGVLILDCFFWPMLQISFLKKKKLLGTSGVPKHWGKYISKVKAYKLVLSKCFLLNLQVSLSTVFVKNISFCSLYLRVCCVSLRER